MAIGAPQEYTALSVTNAERTSTSCQTACSSTGIGIMVAMIVAGAIIATHIRLNSDSKTFISTTIAASLFAGLLVGTINQLKTAESGWGHQAREYITATSLWKTLCCIKNSKQISTQDKLLEEQPLSPL